VPLLFTATRLEYFLAGRSLHVRPGEGVGRPEGEMVFERYRLPPHPVWHGRLRGS
jgi:hypothetical protein